ncbi:MAG: BON domain-containing protein, partial [Alphaproteobacteria bacterium]|nr:BON domain-containing protein [Alphaproteobacteria bacterium]
INSRWLEINPDIFLNVSSQVHEGRVLLSGNVAKPQHRVDAVRVAWQVGGVREVINQIEIRDRSSLIDFARDGWVTTQLTVKLT